MSYNMSFTNSTETLYGIATGVNDASGGLFSVFILVLVALITFTATNSRVVMVQFMNSMLTTSIAAGLLWFADLLPYYIAFTPVVILVTALLMTWFES